MNKRIIEHRIVFLTLLLLKLIFSTSCMHVTAKSYSSLSSWFWVFSIFCFAVAIGSLLFALFSKKDNVEKYWTGAGGGMIMGLVFLA